MNTDAGQKWRNTRTNLLWCLGAGGLLGCAGVSWAWGYRAGLATGLTLLCLALGFWITETIVGVFTRLKKANASAIGLLLMAKALWWIAVFAGAKFLPPDLDKAVAVGIGIFLLALLFSGLGQFGLPRISDGNPPRDP